MRGSAVRERQRDWVRDDYGRDECRERHECLVPLLANGVGNAVASRRWFARR